MVTDNDSEHFGVDWFDIIVTCIVPCILISLKILLNFVMIVSNCVINLLLAFL